ncbi:MAG: tRNA pseudouridine(38-40) synthase TruA [Clostridia bacterium]|nr:tRNA pseudouridine(38-40) synthase TruA [Clostridia bacterium]
MRNLLITMRYDGSAYHGWQVQQNAVTVQQVFQDSIEKLTGVRENVTGCSRTDSGVHALMYCCNFRTNSKIPCERMPFALNAHLPDDISVYDCREVPDDFHARYSCTSKRYIYKIWNTPFRNPFYNGKYLVYPKKLDEEQLDRAAKSFIGTHDFCGFASSGGSVEDTVRTVTYCGVRRCGDEVFFEVEADGFLYNMVRIMVGTVLSVAEGRIDALCIPDIIESKDRERAGFTAPAHGLYLKEVNYGGEKEKKE